tara:strand:- start:12569 stop:13081 length:513 start_codon:yes stop_codon:yes gene_type:complete
MLLTFLSGCSTLQNVFGTKQVEIVTKPIEIEIIQPTLPRPIDLANPKWYVVSEAIITNPCVKSISFEPKKFDDEGKEKLKRPKTCSLEERENPDWPVGYTYLDRFLDDMKKLNNGEVVFVAMTVGDYQMMSGNTQELRRYIRELGEVIIYYRNVTIKDEPGAGVAIKKKD